MGERGVRGTPDRRLTPINDSHHVEAQRAFGATGDGAGAQRRPGVVQGGDAVPFKDILVHMDDGAACAARLEAAIGLAVDYGAHLIGIYVITPIEIPAYVEIHVPEDVIRQQVRAHEEAAARAEKAGVSLE